MWTRVISGLERLGAWVLMSVALIFAFDVVARYAFGVTAAFFPDLEWYGVCLAISLGLGPALLHGAHVRVEVLAERLPASVQRAITVLGHVLLLLPWCAFVVYAGTRYAYNATLIGEGSADPGGLPARWLPKWWLVMGFVLLAGEGLRQVFSRKGDPHSAAH